MNDKPAHVPFFFPSGTGVGEKRGRKRSQKNQKSNRTRDRQFFVRQDVFYADPESCSSEYRGKRRGK